MELEGNVDFDGRKLGWNFSRQEEEQEQRHGSEKEHVSVKDRKPAWLKHVVSETVRAKFVQGIFWMDGGFSS